MPTVFPSRVLYLRDHNGIFEIQPHWILAGSRVNCCSYNADGLVSRLSMALLLQKQESQRVKS